MTPPTGTDRTPEEGHPSGEAASSPDENPSSSEQAPRTEGELLAGDVMTTHLLTVDASDGLLLSWELVSQAQVHHIPVIEHGRCLGLLAERDLALEVARNPIGQGRRLVRELIDDQPAYIQADTPISAVARTLLLTAKDAVLVHTPTGQLIGLITVHDLLRALAGQVSPRPPGQDWDYSPALFRLMPVLAGPTSTGSRR
jgi:predicted transcriptional regulator